jgi:putative ABC transport system permease protein
MMTLWRRLQYLLPWRRRAAERDMQEELRSIADMAAPGELGNLVLAAEDARAQWGWTRLEQISQDVHYAVRTLRKSPTFAAAAILSLALGIGGNTAIFSVVSAVLLRPLPYPESDRLVRFIEYRPADAGSELGYPQQLASIPVAELANIRTQATTLSHLGVYASTMMMLTGRDEPLRLHVTRVSPATLEMLGVRPRIGRSFEPREESPGADGFATLSHDAWQRYFGGASDVLGRVLILDGRSFSIVGVMPDDFRFPDSQTEIWIPYPLNGRGRVSPIGRLADGVLLETASAQAGGLLARLQASAPARRGAPSTFAVERVREQLIAPVRPALTVLAIAVGALLLIACVNVANLLLARTVTRRREIAVRLAIGAGRGRIARQLFIESTVLTLAGAVAGTLLAGGALRLFQMLGTSLPRTDLTPGVSIPRLDEISIDPVVFILTLAVVLTTTVLFGVTPALHQADARFTAALREGTSSAKHAFKLFGLHRVRGLLVIGEIALAMLLLVAGGLLMNSFVKLASVHPGYDAGNLLTFYVPSAERGSPSFNDDLVARLRGLPGVRSAGYAELMPMARARSSMPVKPAQPPAPGGPPPSPIDVRTVSRDFLPALGVPLVAGRGFTGNDRDGQPKVMLINRTLARSGVLGSDPLGTRVSAGPFQWEVVGIVEDVHQYGLDQKPDPQVFFDIRQLPAGNPNPYFAVRTEHDPIGLVPSVRDLVKQLNPHAIVDGVATMEQLMSNSVSRPRLYAVLLGIFAVTAAGLAAIGIYGLIAYSVAERTREFGIRIALGATPADVIGLVLGQSAVLIGAGLLLGLAAAAAGARYLQGLLFGISPLDAPTFLATALMFGVVAVLASYVPGRRATRVDPMVALRNE